MAKEKVYECFVLSNILRDIIIIFEITTYRATEY